MGAGGGGVCMSFYFELGSLSALHFAASRLLAQKTCHCQDLTSTSGEPRKPENTNFSDCWRESAALPPGTPAWGREDTAIPYHPRKLRWEVAGSTCFNWAMLCGELTGQTEVGALDWGWCSFPQHLHLPKEVKTLTFFWSNGTLLELNSFFFPPVLRLNLGAFPLMYVPRPLLKSFEKRFC